ncbi:MAG: ABC transporter substrate-binding protein [Rubrivivax sp.]|nr:ABC transporter substrate-binding protein [Rubrivivax sp.]
MKLHRAVVAWLLAALLPVAPAAAEPITLRDDAGSSVMLARPAERIVSLLPSLTETVCELQACDRLVGVDRHSDWPAAVKALPQLGGLEDTQIERLVALKPDLVLVARSSRALQRLRALGLPVLALEPQNAADNERVIATVAAALGRSEAGAQLQQRLQQRVAAAAARVPAAWRGRALYVEVASTPYAAGEASFIGETIRALGLGNIVPAALGPFPQLNPEFVLRAQPALLVLPRRVAEELPRRPGWARLQAVAAGRICALAADPWNALVRPGPRAADAAEALVDCLLRLAPPA